jgi:hypothetical protein
MHGGDHFKFPSFSMGSGSLGSGVESQQMREELEATHRRLMHAEMQLSEQAWAPPQELQAWLQLTYELETVHFNAKRLAAERQLRMAKDTVSGQPGRFIFCSGQQAIFFPFLTF